MYLKLLYIKTLFNEIYVIKPEVIRKYAQCNKCNQGILVIFLLR